MTTLTTQEAVDRRRIVCAALLDCNGRMVIGPRHFDTVMREAIKRIGGDWRQAEQGFIDQRGVFYARDEAFLIASRAGQILHKSGNPESKELFSEDLY